MRILQIRFKNLNSLVGEWEIDLMHASYAADGIFAITGPTGAGKSVHLGLIASQFMKYENAQIFFFDKDARGEMGKDRSSWWYYTFPIISRA